jgi:hypothetical protein
MQFIHSILIPNRKSFKNLEIIGDKNAHHLVDKNICGVHKPVTETRQVTDEVRSERVNVQRGI